MSERTHYFDNPDNVKRALRIFCALSAGLFLADLVFHRHVIHDWESITGFYAFYGFAACVGLVLLAKLLRKVVGRDESFYEDE